MEDVMTLEEFIQSARLRRFSSNAWVTAEGFSDLYVRFGQRYIGGELVSNVLDLANMTAAVPGDGAFTRLLKTLNDEHPELTLYVENVLTPRFGDRLVRLGFQRVGTGYPSSYVLRAVTP